MTRPPVQPIRPAATVILVREANAAFEIFMLKRTASAAFAGGMYVFPGGRVDGDDHLHRYDAWRVGPAPSQLGQARALGDDWRGYWVAGIRESFEEAGILLAYGEDGELVSYEDESVRARLHAYRAPLHAGDVSLVEICERERLRLAVDRIHFYNRFITPLGRPRRFDTRFFIAGAPAAQTGAHDERETVDSIWISPAEALERNARKEFDLMRVTQVQLRELANHSSAQDVLAFAAANTHFAVHRPVLPADAAEGA